MAALPHPSAQFVAMNITYTGFLARPRPPHNGMGDHAGSPLRRPGGRGFALQHPTIRGDPMNITFTGFLHRPRRVFGVA
jgi:hypothetical protein